MYVSSFRNMSLPHIMTRTSWTFPPALALPRLAVGLETTHRHVHACISIKHGQLDENEGLSGNISILFSILKQELPHLFLRARKIATQRLNDLSEQCTRKRLILSILNRRKKIRTREKPGANHASSSFVRLSVRRSSKRLFEILCFCATLISAGVRFRAQLFVMHFL